MKKWHSKCKRLFIHLLFFPCLQSVFLTSITYVFDQPDWTTGRWCTPNMSVVYPCSGVSHYVTMWIEWQCYQTMEMKYLVQLIANRTLIPWHISTLIPHWSLPLKEVAQNIQKQGAWSHQWHHWDLLRQAHASRRDSGTHVSRLEVVLRSWRAWKMEKKTVGQARLASTDWVSMGNLSMLRLTTHPALLRGACPLRVGDNLVCPTLTLTLNKHACDHEEDRSTSCGDVPAWENVWHVFLVFPASHDTQTSGLPPQPQLSLYFHTCHTFLHFFTDDDDDCFYYYKK